MGLSKKSLDLFDPTLTPGTITMDITEEDGQMYYYIHWIDVTCDGAEAGEVIKGRMERWLRRVWK